MFGTKNYKYLDIIMALFVAVLLISNIASTKMVALGAFSFDGGTLLFPLSYIFGDILTEVYGYKRSRRVIWIGLISSLLMSLTLMIVAALPPAQGWELNDAFNQIIGLTPRIVLASMVAFFAGEFSNSYIMAKMKVKMKGKRLWVRTISSTLVGEMLDTVLFVTIAFYGVIPTSLLWAILISNYIFKCIIEIAFTPITYKAVSFLKKAENEDCYDKNTDFNPFTLKK
jgi:uncharacterized integral membrane protein (TIGR00697 family)